MKDQQKYISKGITSALTHIRHHHKTQSDTVIFTSNMPTVTSESWCLWEVINICK